MAGQRFEELSPTFAGLRILVSPHAMQWVDPPPGRTDDMRAMVDDLRSCGMVAKVLKPAMYVMHDHIFAHPEAYAELKLAIERDREKRRAAFDAKEHLMLDRVSGEPMGYEGVKRRDRYLAERFPIRGSLFKGWPT